MPACLPLPLKDKCSLKLSLVFSNIFIPNKTIFSDSADNCIFLSFHVFRDYPRLPYAHTLQILPLFQEKNQNAEKQ